MAPKKIQKSAKFDTKTPPQLDNLRIFLTRKIQKMANILSNYRAEMMVGRQVGGKNTDPPTNLTDLINALRSSIASETYVLRLFLLTMSASRTPPE